MLGGWIAALKANVSYIIPREKRGKLVKRLCVYRIGQPVISQHEENRLGLHLIQGSPHHSDPAGLTPTVDGVAKGKSMLVDHIFDRPWTVRPVFVKEVMEPFVKDSFTVEATN
jgi:hypothetical protein